MPWENHSNKKNSLGQKITKRGLDPWDKIGMVLVQIMIQANPAKLQGDDMQLLILGRVHPRVDVGPGEKGNVHTPSGNEIQSLLHVGGDHDRGFGRQHGIQPDSASTTRNPKVGKVFPTGQFQRLCGNRNHLNRT